MLDFEKPKLECVEMSENYGRFVVEPLERGFGMTLGNSMRRVLLSSLPGVAATSIRIDGVLHEFSTIEGVKEDVTEIVLNLKGLICKLHSQGPKKVIIDAAGECEVTAGDILPDSDVEIINPELHLATLDENGKLHMEIMLDHGRGYVVADRNKRPDMPIGEIAVDSIYTPITKVNFTVDNTRVGQITDYDKLTLEIWTNGSIKPDEAASYAAKILTEHQDPGDEHRGSGPVRPLLQLPEAGRHQHRGGAGAAGRRRDDEGSEPGPEVSRRSAAKTGAVGLDPAQQRRIIRRKQQWQTGNWESPLTSVLQCSGT